MGTANQPIEVNNVYGSHHSNYHDFSTSGLQSHANNLGINTIPIPVQGTESSSFYDVFDGAAWGPLFDLTEDMGGFVPLGD